MIKNVIQIKSGINVKFQWQCKNPKNYIWNPSTCTFECGKYLAKIIGDSVVRWDGSIKVTITVPTKNYSYKNYYNKNCSDKKCSKCFNEKIFNPSFWW